MGLRSKMKRRQQRQNARALAAHAHYVAPRAEPMSLQQEDDVKVTHTLTTKEKAAEVGRGQTFVKAHAKELGGVKINGQWRFPSNKDA